MVSSYHARLDDVLRSWQDTPYVRGACCRGRGVDCRGLVVGVLDELYGITAPHPARRSPTTAVHDHAGAVVALREITDRYPCRPLHVGREPTEPGDVLVVRLPGQHARTLAHAMIAGGDGRSLWHAGAAGVCYTALTDQAVTHAFRTLDKDRW